MAGTPNTAYVQALLVVPAWATWAPELTVAVHQALGSALEKRHDEMRLVHAAHQCEGRVIAEVT